MFRALLNALLPSQCEVCHTWPARALCEPCVARFAQPVSRCQGCALPLTGAAMCGSCLAHPPPWQRCLAAVDYGYPWSGVVGRFKFEQAPGWATALAQLMRSAPWVEPALDEADVLLPMPLSKERLQERGYNQALLLAQALLPHKVQARTLLRTRHTRAQSELPLKERLRNVEGAFALEPAHRAALAGQRVLLVDDVMTTGASLRAAALPLQQAGVAQLTCLVLARTPAPHDPTSSLEVL